ncbi:MAG: D-alanine--D-alanine ligase, partial [Gemmatimonadota bacterium]
MRITVLTGGASSEREVAIASASQVVAALRARGHTVSVVDLAGGYLTEAEERLLLKGSVNRSPPDLAGLDGRERQ